MIDLNPLVIHREPVKAPRFAPADEYFSTWYILRDKVQYIPGSDRLSGNVEYYACFHDLPHGLQTHVYAPLGLEIRNKWTLGESKAGEAVELGLDIPKQGLWLREDVDMRCNLLMTPFVKKTLKKAHATLVDRLLELSHITESVKSERASLHSRASYGGDTLSIGTNPHASISAGSLPLSNPSSSNNNLVPQLTNASTISDSSVSGTLFHPSQIHPAFRPPAPAYSEPTAPGAAGERPHSPYANSRPFLQQRNSDGISPRNSYIPPSRPAGFFAQGQEQVTGGSNPHHYSKQYEAMRNRAQAMSNRPGDQGVAELPHGEPRQFVAELPAGGWVPEGRGAAELPG